MMTIGPTRGKQGQGSKNKAKKLAYIEREKKRKSKRDSYDLFNEAFAEGGIEAAAKVMGIRLK